MSMRQTLTLAPVFAMFLGTLISALRNAVNFSTPTACALAAKVTSLVVQLYPGGKEVARRIGKAYRIDDRHGWTIIL